MTVAELIEKLKALPQDLIVTHYTGSPEDEREEVGDVLVEPEGEWWRSGWAWRSDIGSRGRGQNVRLL